METKTLQTRLIRPILMVALALAAVAALGAQESSPYQGTSNPPPDDMITTAPAPQPKPAAGQPAASMPVQSQTQSVPVLVDHASSFTVVGGDSGIVQVESNPPAEPGLNKRIYTSDPDGDIVHPPPPGPGVVSDGTTIRVRLLDRLSTVDSVDGETFRTTVASDVIEGGQVLIPTGSEIDGKIARISSGHAGGHGSMILRPETVTLPDGSRYRLYAQTTGTPGSKTHVGVEGNITPNSRLKRDGVEYGGAVSGGAVTGAMLGGPVGAFAGSLVGAGVITAHLLISHPQATLDSGTVLLFTLSEPLRLAPATVSSTQQSTN